MRESKKVRAILVYLKSDVGNAERDGRYKHLYQVCFHCLLRSDNTVAALA
jgi:hypothetical protein